MAKDVLREYLVSIGFQIDEADFKKFRDKLGDSGKRVEELAGKFKNFALVVAGAATVLSATTLKVAESLGKLYYSSQLANTSAGNFRAFQQAAQQVGITAETAGASLTNMARAIRSNPGLTGYLKALGVDPNQKDTVKIFMDLLDRLSTMPFPIAKGIAGQFGIDEDTLFLLQQNREELKKYLVEYEKLQKNTTAQSQKAKEFNQHLNDLKFRLEKLFVDAGTKFLPVAEKFVALLEQIVHWLIEADTKTNGWSSALLAIVGAVGSAVAGLLAFKTVLSTVMAAMGIGGGGAAAGATAFGLLAADILAVVAAIPLLIAAVYQLKGAWDFVHLKGEDREKMHLHRLELLKTQRPLLPEEQAMYDSLKRGEHPLADPKLLYKIEHGGQEMPPSTSNDLHNPGNLRSWGSIPTVERFRKGVSIGKFAQFGSDEEGLQAMAKLLLNYSKRGLSTIASIINEYAPSSENDTSSYIKKVSERMGLSPTARLNLNDSGVLARLMDAMIRQEQGREPFNMDIISGAAKYRLGEAGTGDKTVTIHQSNSFNIQGGGDPKVASGLVLDGQKGVNADLRDLVGVL